MGAAGANFGWPPQTNSLFYSLPGSRPLMPLAGGAECVSSYLIFLWILGLMAGVGFGVLIGLG